MSARPVTYESQEKLFRSNDAGDLLKLYRSFKTFDELKSFYRSRRSADIKLVKRQGSGFRDLVAVVPTISAEGSLARSFGSQFKQLNTFFVESKGWGFNFARSMNAGIDAALEDGAEWVVLSNDDITAVAKVEDILREASSGDGADWYKSRVVTGKHIVPASWQMSTISGDDIIWRLWNFLRPMKEGDSSTYRLFLREAQRFGIEPSLSVKCNPTRGIPDRILSRHPVKGLKQFLDVQPFAMVRAKLLEDYKFDEEFVNSSEDAELGLRLFLAGKRGRLSERRVETPYGSSLGSSRVRWLRYNLFGSLLLASKLKKLMQG